jgi:hypothetical protein
VQERLQLVAAEQGIPAHKVGKIKQHPRFKELQLKSLYLGLSDGARTNELRRASDGEIGNEQIWQAYELGEDKAAEMVSELKDALSKSRFSSSEPRFNLIWLLDDFSGSGNTYIRFDSKLGRYKGKIKKVYERLHQGDLVDTSHYEVFLLLYVATRKAIDHIDYWAERFTSENGFKPLQTRVLCPIENTESLSRTWTPELQSILTNPAYYDERASDKHILVGGTTSARFIQLGEVHGGEGDFGGMCWIPPIYDFDLVGTTKTGLLPGKKEERVPKLSYKSALIRYAGRAGHNKFLSDLVGHKTSAAASHFVGDMKQVRQVTTDRKLMAKYRKQAEQMVESNWEMIQKLAFALFERKRLERREIEDLLGISIGSGGQTACDFRGLAPAAAEEKSVLV